MNEGVIVWRVAWRTSFTLPSFFWGWRFDWFAYTSNRRPMEKPTRATVSHRSLLNQTDTFPQSPVNDRALSLIGIGTATLMAAYVILFLSEKILRAVRLVHCKDDRMAWNEANSFLGWNGEREIWDGFRRVTGSDTPRDVAAGRAAVVEIRYP
jgi:hypothetical protein